MSARSVALVGSQIPREGGAPRMGRPTFIDLRGQRLSTSTSVRPISPSALLCDTALRYH
jgi:hypothetical protein